MGSLLYELYKERDLMLSPEENEQHAQAQLVLILEGLLCSIKEGERLVAPAHEVRSRKRDRAKKQLELKLAY